MAFDYLKYLRTDKMPHMFCPGCSMGTLLKVILRSVENVGFTQQNTMFVSGIGCTSRIPGYVDFDSLHTTHGRALAFATGIKMVKPELNIILTIGDGDATAIGGNHLIHAARRNINITTIIFNNLIYGMTGGQYSPMTPKGCKATTAPFGTVEPPFDICNLAIGAGATFVARAEEMALKRAEKIVDAALAHKGFSLVELTAHCQTSFGRRNKMPEPQTLVEWNKQRTVPLVRYNSMSEEEKAEKLPVGILHQEEKPEYSATYQSFCSMLGEK